MNQFAHHNNPLIWSSRTNAAVETFRHELLKNAFKRFAFSAMTYRARYQLAALENNNDKEAVVEIALARLLVYLL